MKDCRLRDLQRQRRIQEERAAEQKPVMIRRCRSCNAKLREANNTEWCAPCRARAVRMGKPGRAPSD